MVSFLPSDYKVPQKSSKYMKFRDGDNKFRILSEPILGWMWWKMDELGAQKPVRIPMSVEIPKTIKSVDIRHFWAMFVWNYQEEMIQVLELTQKGIQEAVTMLALDPDWGNPTGYDLVVIRSGQKLDTKYQVNPKPAKPVDSAVTKLYTETGGNLVALFVNADPFDPSNANLEMPTGDSTPF